MLRDNIVNLETTCQKQVLLKNLILREVDAGFVYSQNQDF
jgi:hypothetical protein